MLLLICSILLNCKNSFKNVLSCIRASEYCRNNVVKLLNIKILGKFWVNYSDIYYLPISIYYISYYLSKIGYFFILLFFCRYMPANVVSVVQVRNISSA